MQHDPSHEWLSTFYAGAVTAVAVTLALVFSHLTRVFSLCMLAAEGVVSNMIVLAPRLGSTLARRRVWLMAALTSVGFLLQASMYLSETSTWSMPAGSVLPAPLRLVAALPLRLERFLEKVARANCLA